MSYEESPSKTEFDAQHWNDLIRLLCYGMEYNFTTQTQYTGNLIAAIALARLTEKEHPEIFKVNVVARRKLSHWIEQFAQYQEFADGCWLLVRHYDTGNLLSADDWTLVELHR